MLTNDWLIDMRNVSLIVLENKVSDHGGMNRQHSFCCAFTQKGETSCLQSLFKCTNVIQKSFIFAQLVAYTFIPNTLEAEAGGSLGVLGQLVFRASSRTQQGLHREQGYTKKPCLQRGKKKALHLSSTQNTHLEDLEVNMNFRRTYSDHNIKRKIGGGRPYK